MEYDLGVVPGEPGIAMFCVFLSEQMWQLLHAWSAELRTRAWLSVIQESEVIVRGRGTKEKVSRKQFRIMFAFPSWSLI